MYLCVQLTHMVADAFGGACAGGVGGSNGSMCLGDDNGGDCFCFGAVGFLPVSLICIHTGVLSKQPRYVCIPVHSLHKNIY